ncbi:MAG: serine hydrolase, partial [Cyclobacteriaceae bacterium]|nr:serine hydrolase [Cyclobacteriaceae bacterium]
MKKFYYVLFAALSVSPAFSQKNKTVVDKRLEGVEAELQKVLDTWKTPGFAVAVVEKNKIVYAKGFGYRDYENKTPV